MTPPNDTASKSPPADSPSPTGSTACMICCQPLQTLVLSCPPPSCQAPLRKCAMHATCPLVGLLFPSHGGLLTSTSLQGKMPLVLQDSKCPRSHVTSRTPSTSPRQNGATDYAWQVILPCLPLYLVGYTLSFPFSCWIILSLRSYSPLDSTV